jgi:methionyl-tRNA formyltransferase
MRTVLVGAVDSSRIALEVLIRANCTPRAVVTLPLARASRHSDFVDLRPIAAAAGIPVLEATDINASYVVDSLRAMRPDVVFVIGWSQICRAEFLSVPAQGAVGFHPAALPVNRGRAVIVWTILQERAETGSTLFWLDEGVDSGDILAQDVFPVAPDETAATLYAKHLEVLAKLLSNVLPLLESGRAPRTPQDSGRASYCARRTAHDGLIDWRAPARETWRLVRATGRPYPGAFTHLGQRRLVVWAADLVGAAPYCGLPGQVQRVDQTGALVQCGDGEHLLLRSVEVDGIGIVHPVEILKVHTKLGINWTDVVKRLIMEAAP